MADPVNVLAPMSGAAPLSIPKTPKPSVNPDELLSIGDIPSTRKRIYSRVLSAASTLQPLENDQYRLQLENVQYDPADPEEYGAKAHKQAILENRTLGRRLRGQWTLYDKRTNQPIDRKRTTIATVPWLSSDGAFINNGVDTSLSHQMRLRPGVYARIKQTGEIESHANILPGKGPSHRYRLDPETGKFVLEVHQANLPLMPLLRAAGLTDKELEEAWGSRGRDLVRLQHEHDTPANLARVYKAIAGRRADPNFGSMGRPEQQQAVASLLANWEVDPEISKRTLGGPYATIDKDALKAITAKLVRLAEGSDEIDDRDQLAYQTVLGPDDLMAERIARDYGRAQRGIFREAARRGNVQFMPSNTLQRQLMSVFTKSGLANSLEEANPSEVLDRVYRVSRLGEGGLPSTDSVPEASRMVSPSHYGFIDPARTVECYAADMEVMTHRGWLPWSKVTPDDKFACLIGGKLAYRRASALHSGDYVGPMYGARTTRISYLVTPQHRMWVRPGDTGCLGYRFEYAEDMSGAFRKLKCGGHGEYRGRDANIKHFEVPGCVVGSNSQRTIPPIAVDDWYELLGWYLSEGSYVYDAQTPAYRIDISQSKSANPENYARIDALLSRLPMAYSKDERGFSLPQKQLAAYFRQFGDCAGKYIPADAFEAPLSARRRLLESLLLGDGSRETRGNRRGVRVMYSSGSKQLAEDVQCLLFGLGVSSKITIGIDKRKETYLPRYKVNIHENQERELRGRNDHYFIEMYEGKVYCATVPGGLLYVRRDRQTGFWSGNSLRVGVDLYLAGKLRRDSEGNIYAPMQNRQTGETEWKTPREVVDLSMGFDERSDRKRVPAITGGKLQYAEQDKVSHGLQHFEDAFSPLAQLIPMKSGVAPQRVAMGSRMLTQAVALAEPEAPLVRGAMPDNPDQSYEEHYGTAVGAIRADRPGQVLMATPEFVRVRYDDGETKDIELDNNRPLNRKSVTGDTEIIISRRGKIIVTRIDAYNWEADDCTLSVDPRTGVSCWRKVTDYIAHTNERPLLRVRFASGRYVDVTDNHSLVTLDAAGQLVPILPRDCVIGRTMCPVASMPIASAKFSEENYELGVLAGLYLAEGHIRAQDSVIVLAAKPLNRVKQLRSLAASFGAVPHRRERDCQFTDHGLALWLSDNFGRSSGGKFINPTMFGYSDAFRRGLIEGYMSGDGNLWFDSNDAVQLTGVSTSLRLRNDLVRMLSTFGIYCTLFDAPRKNLNAAWNDAYGFRVCSAHLTKLSRWFFYNDRQKKLEPALKRNYRSSAQQRLPLVDRAAAKELYRQLGYRPDFIRKTAVHGYVARHRAAAAVGSFGNWSRGDVHWDTIVGIDGIPAQNTVYDLSVEGTEVFATGSNLIVHNSFRHQTPAVQPGQTFGPGDLLARSNYTDDKGVMALGANFRTAYMPFRGLNHEDAIVISASAAKRLTSEQAYQHTLDRQEDMTFNKDAYQAAYPQRFSEGLMSRLDKDGVIQPGQTVEFGDPLAVVLQQSADTGGVVRGKRKMTRDASLTWDHETPGVITDVAKTKDGINIVVKSMMPMQTGDKLAPRYGDKGVVHIVKDDDMPVGQDGKPIEIIVSDLGVLSRANPAQVAEALLGKVARKTGKPVNVPDFKDIDDLVEWAHEQARIHGISAEEDLIDPRDDRKIPQVLTGERFFMKLHHQAESKGQGRGTGNYTAEERPSKGGEEGCFVATQRVVTSRGWMPIGRICEKRRGEQVLTYSERLGEWVFRPITNWFTYDAPVENVLSIECYGPCENSKGSDVKKYTARHHINATKRHSMLLYDGTRKRAGDLCVGDELVTWGVKPTQHQHELLVGMLMGDGSVSANVIGCTHSGKQDPYFDWKLRMLASLSPTWCEQYNEPSIGSGGYPNCGGRYRVMSITNRLLAEPYADLCLRDGQRTVTRKWLAEMTGLSVAVLFLDDGTATSKGTIAKSRYPVGSLEREKFTGALCTQGFTRKGVERLRRWLMAKYDIKCGIGADNRITLSTRACRALIREVAAWIPWQVIPRSKRGIRRVVKRLQEVTPPHTLNVVSKLVKRPMPVRSITPYRARKGRTTVKVYDVEVAGTHTYCAGPALVSNSKTIGLLQSNAVMSHGATGLLRDAATVRGQANADYWMAVRQGIAPPKPKVPFTYERFINELSAAGINTVSDGDQMHIMALTDKDINERAGNREIQRNDLVRLDDKLSPVTGGLFDQALTGGHGGNAWAKITLPEPMPNPVMEEPIRRVLNLTQNKFRDVLAGRESIATGSGPQAIYRALDAIDLPKELARIRETLKTGRKSARDLAERQLGYLKTAERVGQHPREWMLNSIPVLPPRFRPISLMQHNNQPLVSDINYLYREAIDARDNLKSMSSQVDDVGDERLGLYDAFRAITGMADPQHPKLVEKQVGGVLGRIFGKGSSKYGTLQRKLLSRQVDLVGRGVIVPNPDLDMDSVGLPERRVWPLYGEFVTRRLRRRGFPLVRAMQEVEKRTPLAREELLREMQERPVFVDRAPVLHRFGTMAFYPKLVVGNSIHVSPAVLTGFAADFDGDAVQYHVPADDSAIPEILDRMLPSKNLLSPADFKSPMYVAGKEFIGGLFKATQAANPKARTVRFLSRKDALAAARRGELPLDTPIEVDD